jgi:hypothetical protein
LRRSRRRPHSHSAVELRQTASESLQDAKFAIQESGNWIKNADTKSTVIAAATGVVATASASNADTVYGAFSSGRLGCIGPLLVLLIIAYIGTLIITAVYLYMALSPRTEPLGPANRFAWTSVAFRNSQTPDTSWSAVQAEACQQNYILACIARAKYRAFKAALRWFGGNLVAAILIICISTWATAADRAELTSNRSASASALKA